MLLRKNFYQNKSWILRTYSIIKRSLRHNEINLTSKSEKSSSSAFKSTDIKSLVHDDLKNITNNINSLLSSHQPDATKLAHYYFVKGGKHIRPLIILLVSQAISLVSHPNQPLSDINHPLSSIFSQSGSRNKDCFASHSSSPSNKISNPTEDGCIILPSQRRLAEITEMIHTAS